MNKKGIELAASLIVVLIISIIVLGLAGGLTYKILCASSEKVSELDEQTEQLVEQKLSSGARVQVPISTKTAQSRASFCSKEAPGAAYALGIRNDEISTTPVPFEIECKYKGIEKDGVYETPASVDCLPYVEFRSIVDIASKEKETVLVLVTGPNTDGKHVFTLQVFGSDLALYGAANIYYMVK